MQILIQHLIQPSDSQHQRTALNEQVHASLNPRSRMRKDSLRVAKVLDRAYKRWRPNGQVLGISPPKYPLVRVKQAPRNHPSLLRDMR